MGGCCGGGAQVASEDGTAGKYQKGGENDLANGPCEKRGCTDVLCCILFIAHLVLYVLVSFAGAADGNPLKLIAPRDSYGMYCGIESQWAGYPDVISTDLSSFPAQIYTLNVTSTIDTIATSFICSSSVKSTLETGAGVTEAEYAAACGSSVSTMTLDGMTSSITSSVAEYTDPSKVIGLLTGSGGTSVLSEITKYFYSACVTECAITTEGFSNARTYIYYPSPDSSIYPIWVKMMTASMSLTSLSSLLDQFKFSALPQSICPYADAKMCIPLPGISFTEVYNGYCTFAISGGLAGSMSDAASGAMTTMAESSIAADATSGLDSAVGDVQTTWSVFILVAFFTFVIGLVFLVLLRFMVAPMVWFAIICVFGLFFAGGGVSVMYSQLCADAGLTDTLTAEGINATMTGSTECQMYEIEDQTARDAMFYIGIGLFALAALWFFLICCLFHKIQLAIKINKVGAKFVYSTPHIVILPAIQCLIAIVYCAVWMFFASFLLSQVPDGQVPDKCYNDYVTAMGDADTPGLCNGEWPAGSAFKATTDAECIATGCCWRCYPPRYILDIRFAFSFFSFLWNNAMLVACGQCIIAGACGIWFFSQVKGASSLFCCGSKTEAQNAAASASRLSVCTSVHRTFRYHLGTIAFGSFILAVVQFLKYFMKYLEKQAKAQKNQIVACICKVLGYCLWLFEKCVKFLNKNAYIQTALHGTSFCVSAKNAFYLIVRNAVRMALLGGLGSIINIIGKYFVATSSAVLGFLFLQSLYPDIKQPYVLVFMYFVMGYIVGSLFMNVFALAVDTSLQCFIAAEELDIDKEVIPSELRSFIENKGDEKKNCCGCLC